MPTFKGSASLGGDFSSSKKTTTTLIEQQKFAISEHFREFLRKKCEPADKSTIFNKTQQPAEVDSKTKEMINEIIKQQVNNFKRFLEKEQKNLLLVKTDRNG